MKTFPSVSAYLKAIPPAPRAALQQLRKTIKAAVKARMDINRRKGERA